MDCSLKITDNKLEFSTDIKPLIPDLEPPFQLGDVLVRQKLLHEGTGDGAAEIVITLCSLDNSRTGR
ncbi:MAG: hypothetical protein AB1646_24440 [Thermodesulfobacteriota bacterium]